MSGERSRVCVCACVSGFVRAGVRACVRVCVRLACVCVHALRCERCSSTAYSQVHPRLLVRFQLKAHALHRHLGRGLLHLRMMMDLQSVWRHIWG